MIREKIVRWLFPSLPDERREKLMRKPGKVSIWNSDEEQVAREKIEAAREEELPHPIE